MARSRSVSGFTLIELIMSFLIIAIIAAVTSGIIMSLMQAFVIIPKETRVKAAAADTISMLVDGDFESRSDGVNLNLSVRNGMRNEIAVIDASATQFTYTIGYPTNAEKRNVRIRWDSAAKKLYRSMSGLGSDLATPPLQTFGAEVIVPYSAGSDVLITGKTAAPSAIFTYYKADGSTWISGTDPLVSIARVDISINVKTGSGLFVNWDSAFEVTTGVEIRQYV